MPSDIPIQTRRTIEDLAHKCCEYCHLPQVATFHLHEIDHIIPRQHGGLTQINNLALACLQCNRYKGPNVGSFDPASGKLVAFFNPRNQQWADHFHLDNATITPQTPEGRVTVNILRLNDANRVSERQHLLRSGLYG